jgi:hypothetical protein
MASFATAIPEPDFLGHNPLFWVNFKRTNLQNVQNALKIIRQHVQIHLGAHFFIALLAF